MTKRFHSLRDSNLTGEFLAALLFISSRYTIWPMYLWIREQWVLFNEPRVLLWYICALYFTFWAWLFMFLSKEYKQYSGMSIDALFVGSLLTVASALCDSDVLFDLSKKGFGAAPWVVFLSQVGWFSALWLVCQEEMRRRLDDLPTKTLPVEAGVLS